MAQGFVAFDGYPAPGAEAIRIQAKGDYFGPGNYQQGGYNLNATSIGMSCIEEIHFSPLAQSGNFYARAYFPPNSGNNEIRAIPPTYVIVKWYAANGSEVPSNNTVLAAECAQLWASGI